MKDYEKSGVEPCRSAETVGKAGGDGQGALDLKGLEAACNAFHEGEKLSDQIPAAIRAYLSAAQEGREAEGETCDGCSGYECEKECAYPGVAERRLAEQGLEAATEAYNKFECGSDVDHVRSTIRAYLSAAQEGREAVAWQWRKRNRVMKHEDAWSYVDYHTGLKIAEHPDKYETRPLYTQPAQPAPPLDDESLRAKISGIGNEVHNLGCRYQHMEELSEALADIRSRLWELSRHAPAQPAAQVVEALVLMIDAFLSRNGGSFPMDEVTEEQRLWKHAMKAAYAVVGQPRTRERGEKLAALRVASPTDAAGWVKDAEELILSSSPEKASIIYGPLSHEYLITLLAKRDAILRAALASPTDADAAVELCPDCGRAKAKNAADAAQGLCPKWWAIRDADAEKDCARSALTAAKAGEDGR